MVKDDRSGGKGTKWIRWVARIYGSLVFALIMLFVIGGLSHMAEHLSPKEYLNPITLFLSVLGLAIAWRKEGLGGMISIGFILVNVVVGRWILAISDPPYVQLLIFAIPGILFLVCWWLSRETAISNNGAGLPESESEEMVS
jgi:asparagine N-glycosylation enzyme membrane subunit Stt3